MMTFSSDLPIVSTIASAIEKTYPGFLSEQSHSLDIIQMTGALSALFVQTRSASALSSPALQSFVDDQTTFQHQMVFSQPMVSTAVGEGMLLTTTQDDVNFSAEITDYYLDAQWLNQAAYADKVDLNDSPSSFMTTGMCWEQLESSYLLRPTDAPTRGSMTYFVPGTAKNETEQRMEARLRELCSTLGSTPKLGLAWGMSYLLRSSKAYAVTTPAANATWMDFLEYSTTRTTSKDDRKFFENFPCIPGYSRVLVGRPTFARMSTNIDWNCWVGTYVPGDAGVDYWDIYCLPFGNSDTKRNTVKLYGKIPNAYSSYEGSEFPRFAYVAPTQPGPVAMEQVDLVAALRRSRNRLSLGVTGGAMLFGPPAVSLNVLGDGVKSEFTLNATNEAGYSVDHTVHVITVAVEEYEWTLSRDWYTEYMRTGYGVFTPRVSNIRQNVLNQWAALEYPGLTLRRTASPYEPTLTVLTLPEAKEYARARAKACKDNDWLEQVAISGTTVKWKDVKQAEERQRGRLTWMNTTDRVRTNVSISDFEQSEAVTYTKTETGTFRRISQKGNVSVSPTNEDDQAQILFDRYYNPQAKVEGVTWDELYTPTASETEELTNGQVTGKFGYVFGDHRKQMGFGDWIDPTGRADVANMTDEQRYRLHIRNSVEFDRMAGPLHKVLESFGFDTLIKFAGAKRA